MRSRFLAAGLFLLIPQLVSAEKLTLAHVAVNPSQGMLWVAKDSGILAKYGFTADIVLIPGTPRTIQVLIAGDLDYALAGAPAVIRARMQGAEVVMPVRTTFYGATEISIKDPAGHFITFAQFGAPVQH